jgi:hypothetical protein
MDERIISKLDRITKALETIAEKMPTKREHVTAQFIGVYWQWFLERNLRAPHHPEGEVDVVVKHAIENTDALLKALDA